MKLEIEVGTKDLIQGKNKSWTFEHTAAGKTTRVHPGPLSLNPEDAVEVGLALVRMGFQAQKTAEQRSASARKAWRTRRTRV